MATKGVLIRFSEGELAAIDRASGDVPRTKWIKRLCEDAVIAAEAFNPEGNVDVAVQTENRQVKMVRDPEKRRTLREIIDESPEAAPLPKIAPRHWA